MTTNRVRLTEAAATRFPDLAGQMGTVLVRPAVPGEAAAVFVVWDGPDGVHTWLSPGDVETDPTPLDPSDPNAPAP